MLLCPRKNHPPVQRTITQARPSPSLVCILNDMYMSRRIHQQHRLAESDTAISDPKSWCHIYSEMIKRNTLRVACMWQKRKNQIDVYCVVRLVF